MEQRQGAAAAALKLGAILLFVTLALGSSVCRAEGECEDCTEEVGITHFNRWGNPDMDVSESAGGAAVDTRHGSVLFPGGRVAALGYDWLGRTKSWVEGADGALYSVTARPFLSWLFGIGPKIRRESY